MTREQNFRTSFIIQFSAYSTWQHIPQTEIRKLPASVFPSFHLALGKTTYTVFDPSGRAIQGKQEFAVTVYYSLLQNSDDAAYLNHSDILNIVEQFINLPLYLPPAIIPGDMCSITRCYLTESKVPGITPGDTRFMASIKGNYAFCIF